jgi:hypothetical protein
LLRRSLRHAGLLLAPLLLAPLLAGLYLLPMQVQRVKDAPLVQGWVQAAPL